MKTPLPHIIGSAVAIALLAAGCSAPSDLSTVSTTSPASETSTSASSSSNAATSGSENSETQDAAGTDDSEFEDVSDDFLDGELSAEELADLEKEFGDLDGGENTTDANDNAPAGATDDTRLSVPSNHRPRPEEKNLTVDTIEPTAPRSPKVLDASIHGRETRYPLFAEQPQSQDDVRGEVKTIGIFAIKDGQIDVSTAPAEHREAIQRTFDRIKHIYPPNLFKNLKTFEALTGDASASIGGETENQSFVMTVNTVGNMDHVIIHEMGHQLEAYPREGATGEDFKYPGIENANRTYTAWMKDFWGEDTTPKLPEGISKELYDNYVTAYAASNDGEDFAETFRYFVYLDKPTSSDKPVDKKILLMWDNPMFTDARSHIRAQLGMSA